MTGNRSATGGALVALLLLAACGASTGPTATPPPTAAATPTSGGPRPLGMGSLAAGRYTTIAFEPALGFDLPEGWHQFFPHDSDEIALGGPGADVNMTRPAQVIDPTTHRPADAPESIIDWLAQHPTLGASEPTAVEVADVGSAFVDLSGSSAETALFHYSTGDMRIPAGTAARIYVVPFEGPDLVLLIFATNGSTSLDEAVAAASTIVDSLEIGE